MPSKRRVKRPVTATPKIRISNGGITKPNNQLIRKYHTLNKALSLCEKRKDEKRAAEIRAELEALGGLDAYQQASVKGASVVRGGDTSRWLVKTIGALKLRPQTSDKKWRLLDVGALSADNYARERAWISDDAIDLKPREPGIQQGDFISMSGPAHLEQRYDIVCLSLVINFVGDIRQRGVMLRRVVDFLHPNGAGLCYIVLPLPCITNSRYLNHDRFLAIVHAAGLGRCIHYHHSARLAYYLFQLDDEARMAIQKAPIKTSTQPISTRFPKKEICPGGRRNNFCIVLE